MSLITGPAQTPGGFAVPAGLRPAAAGAAPRAGLEPLPARGGPGAAGHSRGAPAGRHLGAGSGRIQGLSCLAAGHGGSRCLLWKWKLLRKRWGRYAVGADPAGQWSILRIPQSGWSQGPPGRSIWALQLQGTQTERGVAASLCQGLSSAIAREHQALPGNPNLPSNHLHIGPRQCRPALRQCYRCPWMWHRLVPLQLAGEPSSSSQGPEGPNLTHPREVKWDMLREIDWSIIMTYSSLGFRSHQIVLHALSCCRQCLHCSVG